MIVYVYIPNSLADWEIGYLLAEINSKRYFKKPTLPITIKKVGADLLVKKTMGGFEILPDLVADSLEMKNDDLLVLPGAVDTWLTSENDEILQKAKFFIESDFRVAAICGATFGLAKVGALDNKKHTSNDKMFLQTVCPFYSGSQWYLEQPVVSDRQLITASGIAPLEFTYEVIKLLGIFSSAVLENWFQLYKTKDAKYFHALMESLQKN